MLISIITVVKNDLENLKETINSVLSQSFKDYEFLIQDGDSTDGTLDWVKTIIGKYLNIKFKSEKDISIYDAMNKAVARSRGDYIIFLNAGDTFVDDNTLEKLVECAKQFFNERLLVICDALIDYKYIWRLQRAVSYEEWIRSNKQQMPNCHQAILYPKEIFDVVGLYNINYRICADYEHFRRLVNVGYRWECIHIPLVKYNVFGIANKMYWINFRERNDIIGKYDGKKKKIKHKVSFYLRLPRIWLVTLIKRTYLYKYLALLRCKVWRKGE